VTSREKASPIRLAAMGSLFVVAVAGCGGGATTRSAGASGAGGSATGGSATGGSATTACSGHISYKLGGFYGPAPWEQLANVNSMNCAYPQTRTVQACVAVTAVDTWDETGKGAVGAVYVQDTASPTPVFAGIDLVGSSFSPPGHPVPSDLLAVSGTYEESTGPACCAFDFCQTYPVIKGAATFRQSGAVPTPVVLQVTDLNSYDSARHYFNMLVTVQNVVIVADGTGLNGHYYAYVDVAVGSEWSIDNELFDLPNQQPLHQGDNFASVTGIVTFSHGVTLAPRSAADLQLASPPQDAGADGG
jgi:hypothetical protein